MADMDQEGDLGALFHGENKTSLVSSEDVIPYDFKAPSPLPSEHQQTMSLIHQNFASGMRMVLSSFLRADVEVEFLNVEQMSYAKFISSIVTPSCLATFDMHPLSGYGVLDMSPSLIFMIVNRMVGGNLEGAGLTRSFTDLELAVTRRLLKMLLKELAVSWEFLLRIQFNLHETQTNPAFIRITSSNEPCIAVSLTVKIREATGIFTLCFPTTNLDPIADKMNHEQPDRYGQRQTEQVIKAHQKNFKAIELEVSAILGELEITFEELLALQKGDILDLGKRTREPILVRVGDKEKFYAKPGLVGRYKGVSIHQEISNGET